MPVLAMLLAAGLSWVDMLPMEAMSALVDRMRGTTPVRVESTLTLEVRVGDVIESIRPDASVYVFDGDGRGMLRSGDWIWRVLENDLVIEHRHDDAGYVRRSISDAAINALREQFVLVPDPYLTLMFGVADPKELIAAFHDGTLELATVKVEVDDEGRRLLMNGPDATLVLDIDQSGRPASATLDLRLHSNSGTHVTQRWNWNWTHTPLDPDEAAEAVRFDRGGRHRVDDVRVLRRRPTSTPADAQGNAGPPAPPLTLLDSAGRQVRLGTLRGDVVIVDFWASWCEPCTKTLSVLEERAQQWAAEGLPVRLVLINTMERDGLVQSSAQREIAERIRMAGDQPVPNLIDDGGKVARAWSVGTLPATYVIDAEGRIAATFLGKPVSPEQLDAAVRRVVVESASGQRGQ